MWVYVQNSGALYREGKPIAKGYSGFGIGKNNPDLEQASNVGPLPAGRWRIEGPPQDTDSHGPYVLHLTPEDGTDTHGRSGFLIHGDSIKKPGTASHGCLIFGRHERECIWLSGDRELLCVHASAEVP